MNLKALLGTIPLAVGVFLVGNVRAQDKGVDAVAAVAATDPAAEKTPPPPAAESVGENYEDIIINGAPVKGQVVIPATDSRFKFKLKETGTIVEFRWADLAASEQKRVKKLYGVVMDGDRKVSGEKIKGVKVILLSGKFYEGLAIPEHDRPGYKAIKTSTSPVVMISESDIKAMEPMERYESDFFSPLEIYERWMAEKPPGNNDAAAHLDVARRCANIGLFDKALEHLEQAAIIDPRTRERNEDNVGVWRQMYAESQAQSIYEAMLHDVRDRQFISAQDRYQQFVRNFPNSTLRVRADSLKPEIEAGVKSEAVKSIVFFSYRLADELLQKRYSKKSRIDVKGNIVPSIPGKQVVTKQGHMFRGVLMDSIDGAAPATGASADPYEGKEGSAKKAPRPEGAIAQDDIVLKCTEGTITIAGKDIVSIQDIDLSVADKEVDPTYDELKDYVMDLSGPDGLKGEMIKKISELTRLPEKKVQETFDHRLERVGTYKDGRLEMTDSYAAEHQANYGKGSWLREGSKPMALESKNTITRKVERVRSTNGGWTYKVSDAKDEEVENPDTNDDPLIWWKYQANETRLNVLRGMMAEKVFKRMDVPNNPIKQSCPTCANKGYLDVSGNGTTAGQARCPDCRGIGVFFKIRYH